MHSHIDFGYPWLLSWGHFLFAAVFAIAAWLAWRIRWARIVCLGLAAWGLSAGLMMHFGLGIDERGTLPTANFLRSGEGRVLDMGAGTGRSALMVLEERPRTTLVALDLFSDSFELHFGESGDARLRANLRAAGVDSRVTIQKGDMRKMPLESGSFDGAISAYAIDHLGRRGVGEALREARRVLKPGGEFLLMVTHKDLFMNYTVGPLMLHSHLRKAEDWIGELRAAGFEVAEHGSRPVTLYFLCRNGQTENSH